MSLAHKYVNLKEPYNQDIKEQVTTKNFFKKKTFHSLHEISTPEAQCAEGVFQIQFPICGVNISNNISVTQIRVNERKTNLTPILKPLNHELPALPDLIICPHVKYPPINLPQEIPLNCFEPELQNHIVKNIKLGDKFVSNL